MSAKENSRTSCPWCHTTPRDQHTLRTGGLCDRLRSGKPFSEEGAEQVAKLLKARGSRGKERAA